MFEIQERFTIQSHYNKEELAQKFASLEASESIDIFGVKNYYIEKLDKTAKDDCPIHCKVYPNSDGCQLIFVVGDKDFWAKKIEFIPAEPEKFFFKSVGYFAFLALLTGIHFIILPLGILIALGYYALNNVYPRQTYQHYKALVERQKQAIENLFAKSKSIDNKVINLINEIGT